MTPDQLQQKEKARVVAIVAADDDFSSASPSRTAMEAPRTPSAPPLSPPSLSAAASSLAAPTAFLSAKNAAAPRKNGGSPTALLECTVLAVAAFLDPRSSETRKSEGASSAEGIL